MKAAVAFIAGLILGLVLPFLCGRSLSLNVTHHFELPQKRISP